MYIANLLNVFPPPRITELLVVAEGISLSLLPHFGFGGD
jgi:hypothetical protein